MTTTTPGAADTGAGLPQPALLPGFGVLLSKELLEGRRSKRIILFVLIMTAALLLIPLISYARVAHAPGDGVQHAIGSESMNRMLGTWATLVGYLGSLMVIASTVDAMSHERSMGVTAWILTKPVSRASYLMAKSAAHSLIACGTLVLVPTVVWLAVTIALFGSVPAGQVLGAVVILWIEMVVLSFVIIALGVPLRSVAPIAVISLAAWFLPNIVPAIASLHWTRFVLPSFLPIAALSAALGESQNFTISVPLAALVIAALAFIASVVWFERQEL